MTEGLGVTRERRRPANAAYRDGLDRLLDRMDAMTERIDGLEHKVDKLDGWQQRLIGGLFVLVFLATILGGVIADAITRMIAHP